MSSSSARAVEGGPGLAEITELLRRHSNRPYEDIETFVDALVFNWLIGGTDAHAKNYSLLHGSQGKARLAPLYDLASALPYDHLDERKREYRLMSIGLRQWKKAESELHLEEGQLLTRARALARAMRQEIPAATKRLRGEGLTHPIIDRLSLTLRERTRRCLEELSG
jgi:serine/threonine-protein kinase HipA